MPNLNGTVCNGQGIPFPIISTGSRPLAFGSKLSQDAQMLFRRFALLKGAGNFRAPEGAVDRVVLEHGGRSDQGPTQALPGYGGVPGL